MNGYKRFVDWLLKPLPFDESNRPKQLRHRLRIWWRRQKDRP